jgi:psp operon transcriptional activator
MPTLSQSGQDALGESEAFLSFMEHLSQAAKVDRPVLVMGERGTGKELAARRLHFLSPRWQAPLVTLNCAVLPSTLIETELFGSEAGAYTGAQKLRQGRFETAHKGTLFLDEIGNMPLTAQEKLLRVVEYGTFERVGGSKSVKVDVRIVGATNKNLKHEAEKGRFLRDLLDRLAFEVLKVPPLNERGDDIMLLANHFANRMHSELGREGLPSFSQQVEDVLLGYAWPGNVRELKNVVERAVYKCANQVIDRVVFDPFEPAGPMVTRPGQALTGPGEEPDGAQHEAISSEELAALVPEPDLKSAGGFKQAVLEYERCLIKRSLKASRYNQKHAAEAMGLTYHQLRGLLRKHGGIEEMEE